MPLIKQLIKFSTKLIGFIQAERKLFAYCGILFTCIYLFLITCNIIFQLTSVYAFTSELNLIFFNANKVCFKILEITFKNLPLKCFDLYIY